MPFDISAKIINYFYQVKEKEYNDLDLSEYSEDAQQALCNMDEVCAYKATIHYLSQVEVNGKKFPFGITKRKLGISGSLFKLSHLELEKLAEKHISDISDIVPF